MKRKSLSCCFLLAVILSLNPLFGQQNGIRISGKVMTQDNQPLADAYIYIQDTTGKMLHFAQTDASGYFALFVQQEGIHRITVSALEWQTLDTLLMIKPGVHWRFILKKKAENLETVTIEVRKWEQLFKGDTIKYNLEAIRDSTEKNLRDLLEKIPGIEVKDNSITVNGRKVDRLLINGKNLFGSQFKLALDNIESEAVKGIEYYENYADPFSISPPGYGDNGNALNIQLNKSFTQKVKGYIDAATGIKNKYALHNTTYLFGTSHMFYGIGDMNNAGKIAFGLNDYINLQMNMGENNLKIPPFLLDKNLSFDKRDYFGSFHFLIQPSRISEIRGYVLLNKAFAHAQKDKSQIFFDPDIPVLHHFDRRNGAHHYLLSAIRWRKKYRNNLRTELKGSFSHLATHTDRHIIDDNNPVKENQVILGYTWDLRAKAEYRLRENHYFTFTLSGDKGETKDTLQFDRGLWQSPGWLPNPARQETVKQSIHASTGLSYKTKLGQAFYLNASTGMEYKQQHFFIRQTTSGSGYMPLNRLDKYVSAGFFWRWKQWFFRPKLTWRFTSLFSPVFHRYDHAYWLASVNINGNFKLAGLSFFYRRSLTPPGAADFYPALQFTGYQTAVRYEIAPGDVGIFHYTSFNLTSKHWWRGFHMTTGINTMIRENARQNLYSYEDHFYTALITTGKNSVIFNETASFRQKIPNINLSLKYNFSARQQKGTYLTSNGEQIQRTHAFKHRTTVRWGPKNKMPVISVHSEWENIHNLAGEKTFFMQNRKLEGRVKWHNRKWDVMFSIQKLWLQSGSILSHPVIPSFKTVYKPKAAFEIYLEAFDFFHLDTWRINRFETTDLYYQIAREWHQAGYILLGFKWSY